MSHRPTTYESSSRRTLPSIRDVIGDVLQQPATPRSMTPGPSSPYSSTNPRGQPFSNGHYRGSSTSGSMSHRTGQAPPMRPSSTVPPSSRYPQEGYSRRDSTGYYSPSPSGRGYTGDSTYPAQPSSHSYDVFVASDQGLVHQRSSTRDDFRQISREEAISMSTGRHACPECGRRFDKLSHYKSHLTTHTGEKPYQCPWPGCGKCFSASSNMRRHYRGHTGEEAQSP